MGFDVGDPGERRALAFGVNVLHGTPRTASAERPPEERGGARGAIRQGCNLGRKKENADNGEEKTAAVDKVKWKRC